MDDFEYTVIVRGGNYISATARYAGVPGPSVRELQIEPSQLQRDTIRILQEWLGRWGVLSRVAVQYEKLCVPDTFKVLGQYLYEVIFPGDIGRGFDDAKREAEGQGAPLRVVLRFEEDEEGNNELAAFAWEFLYHPPDRPPEGKGYFIAAETDLTLSRLLSFGNNRPELPESDLPLRVLFIVSTPESLEPKYTKSLGIQLSREQWRDYDADRKKLVNFVAQFQTDARRLTVRTILVWNESTITDVLTNEEGYNIIHMVGVCRSPSNGTGEVEIALPGADGSVAWQSAQVLVDLLQLGIGGGRLGLVVLHLCEASRSDYTATFERFAPRLVRAGIPAVLAMQYPVPATDATRFTEKFYELLTEEKEIGQAVQEARKYILSQSRGDRVFGTAALYLQSVDGQLVRGGVVSAPSPPERGGRVAGRARSEALAEKMHRAVRRSNVDTDTARELNAWIDTIDWTGDRVVLERRIRARMHTDANQTQHGQVYNEMLEIVAKAGAVR